MEKTQSYIENPLGTKPIKKITYIICLASYYSEYY